MSAPSGTSGERTVVLNPVSGTGDHVEQVRHRARDRGYAVRATDEEGAGVDLAREAAEAGASLVAAAGGDGTLNEVIRGVERADALDLPLVGGSDAHYPFEVGRAYTAVDADAATPEAVVDAVRDGRVDACVDDRLSNRLLQRGYEQVHAYKARARS